MKPDRQAFQYVLDSLPKEASETAMIGDSFNSDIQGAKQVGMEAIWLRRNEKKGKMYIRSLGELINEK